MTSSADAMRAAASPSASSTTTTPKVDEIAEALMALARGTPTDLAGLLHGVESHAMVDKTNVTAHCYCIQLDAHGQPKTNHLVRLIAEQVTAYAIPRTTIREAGEDFAKTKNPEKFNRLHNDARKLFTELSKSGEGGELLLFVLAEKLLGLPQLICKMDLKTSTQMHVHGADGLHAGVDPANGRLLLYWGESKIYGDVSSAIRDCLASVAPMLSSYSAGERDLQLLQRYADLDNAELEAALKKFLDPDSEAFNSLEFRGLCLVGFDCDAYPAGPSKTELATMAQQIATALPGWRDHVAKRIVEEKLDTFAMHFLFVPFPSADGFRDTLREQLGLGARGNASTASAVAPAVAVVSPGPTPAAIPPAKPSRGRRTASGPGTEATAGRQETRGRKAAKGTPSGTA